MCWHHWTSCLVYKDNWRAQCYTAFNARSVHHTWLINKYSSSSHILHGFGKKHMVVYLQFCYHSTTRTLACIVHHLSRPSIICLNSAHHNVMRREEWYHCSGSWVSVNLRHHLYIIKYFRSLLLHLLLWSVWKEQLVRKN